MKKNIIALAVAGALAAPLAAQAEVTISGGLQAEVVNLSGDKAVEGLYAMDGAEDNAENSGNFGYLKFSASEDLGGGMTALAVYNFNTNVGDTGSAGLATRDAYVGLSGGFGTVLAGTLATPYKSSTVKWDPFLATFAQARGSYGMSGLHNSYFSNAVAYANQFGPAKFVAAVVLDEGADPDDGSKTAANHALSASLNVPVGPVEIAVAYIDASEHVDGGYGEDASAAKVGVKFASGAITVAGQYETLDEGLGDYSIMYLTGSYAMGANTFSLSVGADDKEDDEGTYTAVGMKHAFSKTTSVHVAYRANEREADGSDVSAFGAGLRVKF
jgi:predicted porin